MNKMLIPGALTVMATGLSVVFLESARELHTFRTVHYTLSMPSLAGMRILFVTDYHEAVGGKMNDRLITAARRIDPDLILIGGDLVNGTNSGENTEPAVGLINGLAQIAPTVHAYGNHECKFRENPEMPGSEWEKYRKSLDPQVRFVENEQLQLPWRTGPFRIAGLNAPKPFYTRKEKMTTEDVTKYLGKKADGIPTILLPHDPTWFSAYAEWGADLTLAGHFHGGVIRFPLLGGFVDPKLHFFPKYDYGIFEEDGKIMLVSSGLGQHTLPVRWFNTPELVAIDLTE
ncbi:MAG: metallophosphoesterase [Eubacterium sp.]|nr:metallophosphoesterase [Eubacterium sp.]